MSKQLLTSPWATVYNDFDYDNVDPETLKKWEAEFRRDYWRDMRSYLKHFPDATPEEKKALRKWVRQGHSPYENGDYIANESGSLMDFINAWRFLENKYQEYMKNPEDFLAHLDEPLTYSDPSLNPGSYDLPF
ncbi:MAG: hypothetical protein IKZ95_00780 [Lachnospiraceae bacterium]|nr:hypothetical protein [Lachnospiraceae bacterium]